MASLLTKVSNLFGNENEKTLKRYHKIVAKINALEPEIQKLQDHEFPTRTEALKKRVRENTRFTLTEQSLFKLESELSSDTIWKQLKGLKGKNYLSQDELLKEIENRILEEQLEETRFAAKRHIQEDASEILDSVLPEAFALVREAAVRVLGERHYDVQLIGGIALHEGNIAEMQTGEGKTLASTCPSYLNALTGRGVHIVTPNDYLAKRDSEWMGRIYNFLGISVGLIQHDSSQSDRQFNYRQDITYGTNNEYGFDYLRDNMKMDLADYVQREFAFAIVDEVDSILIDEARTPLIISGPTDDNIDKYVTINQLVNKSQLQRELQKIEVPQLTQQETYGIDEDWEEKEDRDIVREGDYTLDEKSRYVALTDRGAGKIEQLLYNLERYQLTQEGLAKLESEIHDESIINGLHNTVGIEYRHEEDLLAHLSQKIGEEQTAQFKSIILKEAYQGLLLPTFRISEKGLSTLESNPEIKSVLPELKTMKDLEYETIEAFLEALRSTIGEEKTRLLQSHILPHVEVLKSLFDRVNTSTLHHVNQALKAHLIFNRDVDYVVQNGKVVIVDDFTGRLMQGRRYSDGLHQALEAKERVRVEMESQTLASVTFQNYFRLYRKLAGMTGTAETEKDEFKKIYNLGVVVIPTNQTIIRQDHPDVIYKTEDAKYNAIANKVVELHEKGQPVLVGTVSVETSELISNRLNQKNISHRVLNAKFHEQEAEIIKQAGQKGAVTIATNMAGRGTDIKLASEVLELGGLFILGTARHDSRRIDNQLRGRSGRQGDPGESQFFLSMEDHLLRIFGGEKLARWMDRLQIEEDMPIEHVFVSKAIANAQKKVEGMHFTARKNVLEYDDIMERQRNIIYEKRRAILSDDIHHGFLDMCAEMIEAIMDEFCSDKFQDQWKWDEFKQEFFHLFNMHLDEEWETPTLQQDEIIQKLYQVAEDNYESKINHFQEDFFHTYQDSELLEVIGIYLQLALHYEPEAWAFPYPEMEKLQNFCNGWFERFREYCQTHGAAQGNETIAQFLNQISTEFRQQFSESYTVFRQEIFETLLLLIQRQTLLMTGDERWKNHLLSMDHLREEVGLAGYAQKKPIDEYRRKAFALFEKLITETARESVIQFFHRGKLPHPRYLFFHVDPQTPEPTYHHSSADTVEGDNTQTRSRTKASARKKNYVSSRDRKKQRQKKKKTTHSA
ncbi:MAG: preprotein translocase subunit SecA [SAR324 cluster bacterium]|nr:preprotein translocase subunit SecA [SAR324 cluster bacterium]